jgi:hypothetical protein
LTGADGGGDDDEDGIIVVAAPALELLLPPPPTMAMTDPETAPASKIATPNKICHL